MIQTAVPDGATEIDMDRILLLVLVSLCLCASSEAQESPSPPAPAACTTDASPYRDFDFWIGEWEVYRPGTDERLGRNFIAKRENGCLLVEDWTGARGGTGMSMNFVDPFLGKWRQVWQSPWGFIDYSGGLDDEGRMVLEGRIHTHASGQDTDFRGRWTPREDGSVLQEFWQRAEGEDWERMFAGEYRRKEFEPVER